MTDILYENQEDPDNTVRGHAATSLTRLKKSAYVLPSGRVLKVVVYDEREMVASAA